MSATPKDQLTEDVEQHLFVRYGEDLKQRPLAIRLAVEFFGTFLLVTVAAGAGVISNYVAVQNNVPGPISTAMAVTGPGLLVMALIYALGPLSGLHINPAVTLAFTARGTFKAVWAIPYVIVQFAGAITASLFLQWMFGDVAKGGNYPFDGQNGKAFVMEIVLTLILVTVILNTATGYRSIGHNAALAVGGTIILNGLFAAPISGASMNPARSLGPDIVSGDFSGWWVYAFAPLIGAALAVGVIGLLRGLPTRAEIGAAEGDALKMSAPGD